MKVQYYLGIRQQPNGYYVHRADCPVLPPAAKRIKLGLLDTPAEAAIAAKSLLHQSCGCLFCMKSQHMMKSGTSDSCKDENRQFLSEGGIKVTMESAFLAGIN